MLPRKRERLSKRRLVLDDRMFWTPESVHGLFAEPLARRRMIREQTRMLGRWWRGEGGERLAGSVVFGRALPRASSPFSGRSIWSTPRGSTTSGGAGFARATSAPS